jgi:hypothetical protein
MSFQQTSLIRNLADFIQLVRPLDCLPSDTSERQDWIDADEDIFATKKEKPVPGKKLVT